MKKLIQTGITALLLSLAFPAVVYADGDGAAAATLCAQADAVINDLISTADVMKRGTFGGSQEGRAVFEKLDANSMALMELAVDSAQAANPAGLRFPSYTQEDLYILAHVICGEAQSYPDDEQLYVGSVVLNRVGHPSFPNTIQDVVFQRGQYACTRDGNYNREPTPQNWANAKYLLENGSVLPGNVVWQSGGRQGNGVYIRTRYHCYCY